ncbi:hypothetical protein, partial [Micromonospora noduli]|uniref:hypothetical protein n=1 Tax=Micromonospora noduli TaxID=709876 RepID=UPI001C65949A
PPARPPTATAPTATAPTATAPTATAPTATAPTSTTPTKALLSNGSDGTSEPPERGDLGTPGGDVDEPPAGAAAVVQVPTVC